MSETSDYKPDERKDLQELSHRRIILIMAAVVSAGSILSSLYVSLNFGLGFLIGGALSFVNYYWLKSSLKTIFDRALSEENPRFAAGRYSLRYLFLAAVLAVVYFSKAVSFTAVVLGLLSFAFAVLIEGLIRIFKTFFYKREI
jgi:hypothetical protein